MRKDAYVFVMELPGNFYECPDPGLAGEQALKQVFTCAGLKQTVGRRARRIVTTPSNSSGEVEVKKFVSYEWFIAHIPPLHPDK